MLRWGANGLKQEPVEDISHTALTLPFLLFSRERHLTLQDECHDKGDGRQGSEQIRLFGLPSFSGWLFLGTFCTILTGNFTQSFELSGQ